MVITGEPSGQNGFFGNDLATMLDPNQPLYRLAQRMPWNDLVAFLANRYATNGSPVGSTPPDDRADHPQASVRSER